MKNEWNVIFRHCWTFWWKNSNENFTLMEIWKKFPMILTNWNVDFGSKFQRIICKVRKICQNLARLTSGGKFFFSVKLNYSCISQVFFYLLCIKIGIILWCSIRQWARKFKKSPDQKNSWNKMNQFHGILVWIFSIFWRKKISWNKLISRAYLAWIF